MQLPQLGVLKRILISMIFLLAIQGNVVNVVCDTNPCNIHYNTVGSTGREMYLVSNKSFNYLAVNANFSFGQSAHTGSGDYLVAGSIDHGYNVHDATLIKFFANGSFAWLRNLTTSNNSYANGVAVDELGNSYVCGTYYNFSMSEYNGFWQKYDATGTLMIDIRNHILNSASFYEIFLAPNGDILVTTVVNSFFSIYRYDNMGNYLMKYENGSGSIYDLVVDTKGDIYAVGSAFSARIVKFFANTSVAWALSWGSTVQDTFYTISINFEGNIIVAGNNEEGSQHSLIVKITPEGGVLWQRRVGGDSIDDMVINAQNEIFLLNWSHIINLNTTGDIVSSIPCFPNLSIQYDMNHCSTHIFNFTDKGYEIYSYDRLFMLNLSYRPLSPILRANATQVVKGMLISLNWSSIPDATEYLLYNYYGTINTTVLTEMTIDTSDFPFQNNSFSVVACNASGKSQCSNEIFISLIDPPLKHSIEGYPLYPFIVNGICSVGIIIYIKKRLKK